MACQVKLAKTVKEIAAEPLAQFGRDQVLGTRERTRPPQRAIHHNLGKAGRRV